MLAERYLYSLGSLKVIYGHSHQGTSAAPDCHQELDTTEVLLEDEIQLYQRYIGIMCWAIELGQINLANSGEAMSKLVVFPIGA